MDICCAMNSAFAEMALSGLEKPSPKIINLINGGHLEDSLKFSSYHLAAQYACCAAAAEGSCSDPQKIEKFLTSLLDAGAVLEPFRARNWALQMAAEVFRDVRVCGNSSGINIGQQNARSITHVTIEGSGGTFHF